MIYAVVIPVPENSRTCTIDANQAKVKDLSMSQWDQFLDRLKADVNIIIGTYASTSLKSLLNNTNEAPYLLYFHAAYCILFFVVVNLTTVCLLIL